MTPGAVTSLGPRLYRANDQDCTPQVYPAGYGYVDQGGTSMSSATMAMWSRRRTR